MPDVFEQLGEQLRAAHPTPRGHRVRVGRRLAAALAGTLLVAAPAVAITQPWDPELERAAIDRPVTESAEPVAASAREALAVLRRAQTQEDRRRTAPLLTAVGAGNQVSGVQTDGIRELREGWALVPAREVQVGERVKRDQLCFTDGRTVTCGSARNVTATGIIGTEATTNETIITGLVPDGVAYVRFRTPTGERTSDVRSNFFELRVDMTQPKGKVRGPDGSLIPAPPLPARGTIDWLDGNGNVVGPRG